MAMRVTLLGTGDAAGLPVWGCRCPACEAARRGTGPRRGPCSALVETAGLRLLIDGGVPDLADRFPPDTLDAILLTHFHADHVLGLTRLRWGVDAGIDVFCPPDPEGYGDLLAHPGALTFRAVEALRALDIRDVRIWPVPLVHSRPCFGWLIACHGRRLAYLTDTAGLPAISVSAVRGADLAVLDCSFPPGGGFGRDHNDLTGVMGTKAACGFGRTLLTHIGHHMQNWLDENSLPQGVRAAWDGMTVDV